MSPHPDGDAAATAEGPHRWVWALDARIAEARLALVAEFLESCLDTSSEEYPYQPARTLQSMHAQAAYDKAPSVVHVTHQQRLANAIQALFCSPSHPARELRTVVVHSRMFAAYADVPLAVIGIGTGIVPAPPLTTTFIQDPLPPRAWLDDDADARA